MALSKGTIRRLMVVLGSQSAGNEVATAINSSVSSAGQTGATLVANIVATSVSTTTNFAALQVGDIIVHVPATPGSAGFEVCAVAGTKPSAAVIGDLYQVSRALIAPAASKEKL